jgi:hypothetical protein
VHNIEVVVRNVEKHGELAKYKKMVEDSKKSFYHGCTAQYTRLFTMVNIF